MSCYFMTIRKKSFAITINTTNAAFDCKTQPTLKHGMI